MGGEMSFSIFDSSPPPVRRRRTSSIRSSLRMSNKKYGYDDDDSLLNSIKKSASDVVKMEPKRTLLDLAMEHRKKMGMEPPEVDFNEVIKRKLEDSRAKTLERAKRLESIQSSDESEDDEDGWDREKKVRKFAVSSHKDPVPWEGCQFDLTSNPIVWERIVANSLMGSNLLRKALVFNMVSGGVYACSPPLFMPTVQQAKTIASAVYNPSIIAKDGIIISDNVYMYDSGEVGSSLTAFTEDHDVMFYMRAGTRSAVVVVFNKLRRDKVFKLIEELFEYFTEVFQF